MNRYLQNLAKIEFVVTYACTGRCKHCSQGEHSGHGERIDPSIAADAVRKVASVYHMQTVMTFGGEPLLYPEAVYAIHATARDVGVPHRQLITNGFFARDISRINEVADGLARCGVNDILLSVDAFHQETIPLEAVRAFAEAVTERGIPLRLQPAWLVRAEDDNPYNIATRKILNSLDIPANDGNVIYPEGNALKYLGEYFGGEIPVNPYTEDPYDVRCISFEHDGTVLGDNVYQRDILDILRVYGPKKKR